jgi:hypothetical protein
MKQTAMQEQIKCYCGHTSYCDCGPQEETKQNQVERMYSEEEVEKIARAAYTFGEKEFKYFGAFKEWFEQFKKQEQWKNQQ